MPVMKSKSGEAYETRAVLLSSQHCPYLNVKSGHKISTARLCLAPMRKKKNIFRISGIRDHLRLEKDNIEGNKSEK